MTSSLFVVQKQLGPANNFIYLIGDSAAEEVVVVDPAWDAEAILSEIELSGCRLTAVWLTHGHPDHINGVEAVTAVHDVPVYLSENELPRYRPAVATKDLQEGQVLMVGKFAFTCWAMPGHAAGHICFWHGRHFIAGDVLFVDGCGRCDLPGSDVNAMYDSLQRLKTLPDETVIYPGHDYGPRPNDTIANQMQTNPYLLAPNREAFVQLRMG